VSNVGVMSGSVRRTGGYAWYVAALLSVAHLVSFIDRFVMSLVLEPVRRAMALSDTQLGLLVGFGFVLLYSVVGMPLGLLADRVHRRNLIALGILVWSCATAACAFADDFTSLFAARAIVGFGEAALVPAAMSLIANYFPRSQLARAVSIFTMGASLGKTTAFLAGGALLALLAPLGRVLLPGLGEFAPWQVLFLAASLPGFLLVPLLLTVREIERPRTQDTARPSLAEGVAWLRGHAKAYALHVGAAVCSIILIQIFGNWSASLFVRVHGFSVQQAGYVIGSATLLAGPAGHFTGGWMTDRMQARGVAGAPLATIAISLAASACTAVLLYMAPSVTAAVAAFTLLMFVVASAAASCLSGVQTLTPAKLRGFTTSVYMCVMTLIAVGLGPTFVGIASDLLFGGGSGLESALVGTTLLVASIGIVLALCGRRPFQRTADAVR
jgi:MFS family permease